MDERIVFVRTSSGEDEARSRTALLSKDIKRALLMVDGASTVAEIKKRSSPSLRIALDDMFEELLRDGFIQDKARIAHTSKLVRPSAKKSINEAEELDFTAAFRVPTQALLAEEAARQKASDEARDAKRKAGIAEERARLEAAEARSRELAKAEKEAAEALRLEAERQAKTAVEMARRAEQQAEKIKAESLDRARIVAEEKARLEAEVAKLKAIAESEAKARAEEHAKLEAEKLAHLEAAARAKAEMAAIEEAARRKADRQAKAAVEAARLAEQHAEQVKYEAQARARAIAEEKARLEAEVVKLKAIAEAEAQARAEERARMEAERAERRELASKAKAEKAALEEAARMEAERLAKEAIEVEKAKAEERLRAVAEEKARLEAEVLKLKAVAEAEAQAKRDAETLRIKAEQEAERIKAEQEAERIKAEQEAERIKAEQEAERIKAEQEAERIKAEQEERIKAEQEAERIKAEQEAERIKAEQEAERIKAEQEAERIKAEQEAERIKAEQEAERIKAEQEAERIKAEQEAERIKAEQEAEAVLASVVRLNTEHEDTEESFFLALNESVMRVAECEDADFNPETSPERRTVPAVLSGCDSRGGNNGVPVVERRTTTAAVLFLDIAGYTKQSDSKQLELKEEFNGLLTESLASLGSGERISLDTGDGAAIGFLQHPADALESAVRFRTKLIANKHFDYPDLRIRFGIHLGPVSLVKDMNGQINMLGDGINSAQRVMSFAGLDQILVSRAYFDFVSSMSDEYDELFRYRGSQQDKHGREYRVYELIDGEENAQAPVVQTQSSDASAGFNFEAFDVPDQHIETQSQEPEIMPVDGAEQLLVDTIALGHADVETEHEKIEHEVKVPQESLALEDEADPYARADTEQLADAQAKKWQEAEQRAIRLAKERSENVPHQRQSQPATIGRIQQRKPLPWGKMLAGLMVLCVLALFILPFLLPMEDQKTSLERLLGSELKQPVHIGRLSGRILPTPRLVLDEVSIGDAKQIQVANAQANFSMLDLGAIKIVNSLDLRGVVVKGGGLQQAASWIEEIAGSKTYPIAKITLSQGKLDAEGMPLSDVDGEIDFSSLGKFSRAHLNALSRKLAVNISADPSQKLSVSTTLHDSALPFLPDWSFDDLKANGELSHDELRITDLDGRIKGGAMTGNVRVNWRSGWRVQGDLVAKVVPLENINKLLTGEMDGTARFQSQADSLSSLADNALFNGVFDVKKGMIGGVDIVESTRLMSRENLPGGRTHFDELSGELFYSKGGYRFSKISIRDSVFQANGSMTVEDQAITGRILSSLKVRSGMPSVMLQVSGTVDSPSLRVAN